MKKNIRINKIILSTIIMLLFFPVNSYGSTSLPDIKDMPYEEAVNHLFERGIITGDENGNFNPNQNLTRAQACIIIVKSMKPSPDQVEGTATQEVIKSGFPDMNGYGWAEGYIGFAVRAGITKGYPDGKFKPGNQVTPSEFITMILRAAGYGDESLPGKWPLNYIEKADELKVYEGLPTIEAMPIYSTKWIAAQMAFNSLKLIDDANYGDKLPYYGFPNEAPSLEGYKYSFLGKFNSSVLSYDGIPISSKAEVLSFGYTNDYNKQMSFSENKADYSIESIYKYKDTITPGFYIAENNQITKIILPKDVGFTGDAYSVINNIKNGIDTLTATKEIKWYLKPGIKSIVTSKGTFSGDLYNLNLENGQIVGYSLVKDLFSNYAAVTDVKADGTIMILMGQDKKLVEISKTPTVYINNDRTEPYYRVGRLSDLKAGCIVKLYDISDDEEVKADVIIIKEN